MATNKRAYLLSSVSLILLLWLSLYIFYKTDEKILKEKAESEINANTEFVVGKIEIMLNSLKKTPQNLKSVLENTEMTHNELVGVLHSLAQSNEEIFGLCAAFEKNTFHKDSIYYEPYFYKDGDSLVYTNYSTFPEDYFSKEWYKEAYDANQPVWIEPYADSSANLTVMASYSVPFYDTYTGQIKGIAVADLFLDGLQNYLSSFSLLKTGYVVLFSKEGSILSHPQHNYIMLDSMQSLAQSLGEPVLKTIFNNVQKGESDTIHASAYFGQANTTLYYHTLHTGWGLVLSFPDAELYKPLYDLQKNLITAGVLASIFIVVLAFILFYMLTSRNVSKQNEMLEVLVNERTKEIQYKNEALVEQQNILSEKNELLLAAEEELRQNLEELQTLNENIELHKIELEQQNEELNKSFTAIKQSPLAIVVTKPDGVIEYINPFFTKLTGYTPKDVIGKKTNILKSGKNERETYTNLWETISSGSVWKGEFVNRKKDGSEFIEKAIIAPIFDSDNKIISYVSIKEDVTTLKQTQLQVEKQSLSLQLAYKNITDSINYAKNIQAALLTHTKLIDTYLNHYFLLFKPKDVVSGDFYFVSKLDHRLIFAVADCTGHGVPGGFMTMLAITYMQEVIHLKNSIHANDILEELRNKVKNTFSSFGTENRNGLDIVLCIFDNKENTLEYAGANLPLYIVRNNKLLEYKPNRNPIGFYPREESFINNEIKLQSNDMLYLCSDGFQDQFGGLTNRKYTRRQLKSFLLQLDGLPITDQYNKMNTELDEWKHNHKQVDDITILGVKWTS